MLLSLVVTAVLALAALARAQQGLPQPAQPPAAGSPDFRLSAAPGSVSVRRGQTGQITVKVESVSGFQGKVDLVSSLLYETNMTFSPTSVDAGGGSAVLSISPSRLAIKGDYELSITGLGGGISHFILVGVTVK